MGHHDTLSSASARIQSNVVKAITGYYRLKDFIHAIRTCKTVAEERTLVARESASIRTSFKEDISSEQQYHAVAKLLFIYMMGYPAHFGQVESLKMVAAPRIMEKRLGYLGSTQLLDEHQPTLTLITNSIKSDLNNSSQSIVALALANLAASASPDISRDLVDEVERLLQSNSPYIKKKAAFCAARMINRVPELAEYFETRVLGLLTDRNHAVVMGGISLTLQLCQANPQIIGRFRKQLVAPLVRQLQAIMSGGFSGEYDVSGISDPFLQVRILRLLRLLGEGDVETSESVSDILTQIATSTDPAKNVGHSVLYETAVTIMNIESDPALRTMAINILGRLLSSNSSDNNLRYVALTLLNKIIYAGQEGLSAVQRHRATILECLHDPDVSIRRRAVDLSIALISRDTIRIIAAELLDVLRSLKGMEELDFKQSLVTRLSIAAAQHAPSAKWYVDTMKIILVQIDDQTSLGLSASVLSDEAIAGRKEEIVSTFVRIINNTAELHRYATEELYKAAVLREGGGEVTTNHDDNNTLGRSCQQQVDPTLKADLPQVTEALIQATTWVIGEFADILLSARLATAEQLVLVLSEWALPRNGYPFAVIGYIITALGKLANRLPPTQTSLIVDALECIGMNYVNEHNLHYRAMEMRMICKDLTLRLILLARIPTDVAGDQLGRVVSASKLSGSRPTSAVRAEDSSISGMESPPNSGTPRIIPALDVFAELATLSLDGAATPSGAISLANVPLSGLGVREESSISPQMNGMNDGTLAFSKEGLLVYFRVTKVDPVNGTIILAKIHNGGNEPIEDVLLQAAVPKSMKLELEPADGAEALPGSVIKQVLKVFTSDGMAVAVDKVKLRVKLLYRRKSVEEGETHVFDVSKFQ